MYKIMVNGQEILVDDDLSIQIEDTDLHDDFGAKHINLKASHFGDIEMSIADSSMVFNDVLRIEGDWGVVRATIVDKYGDDITSAEF